MTPLIRPENIPKRDQTYAFKRIRTSLFEHAIKNATNNIILADKIKEDIVIHSQGKCTSCSQTAIRFAQKRLDRVNDQLSKTNSRVLRIARRRLDSKTI